LGSFFIGSKLANLFSKSSSNEEKERSEYGQHVSHSSKNGHGDQVDEHIYEELDSLFVDASAQTTTPPPVSHQQMPSSFFGARISRAEILDYLNDARGRLAETIENTET